MLWEVRLHCHGDCVCETHVSHHRESANLLPTICKSISPKQAGHGMPRETLFAPYICRRQQTTYSGSFHRKLAAGTCANAMTEFLNRSRTALPSQSYHAHVSQGQLHASQVHNRDICVSQDKPERITMHDGSCPCVTGSGTWKQLDQQQGVTFPSRHHTHTFTLQHPISCR